MGMYVVLGSIAREDERGNALDGYADFWVETWFDDEGRAWAYVDALTRADGQFALSRYHVSGPHDEGVETL